MYIIYIYLVLIYIYTLLVCLSVCLFVSNKRQNGRTDSREGLWMIQFKNLLITKFVFFKTLKINDFFNKIQSANLFLFVFQCLRREHVHSWSRRWAQSALKAYYILFILNLSPFLQSFIAYFSNNSNTSTDNSSLSLSSWHSSETGGYKYAT